MRMTQEQRDELFELWKRAPFPEIASAVDGFMQGVAAQVSGASEVVERGDDSGIYSGGAGTRTL